MSGTKTGGQKAALTNKAKHGEDFYAKIGRKGGKNGHTGGFAANPELAKEAGRKGGKISKRGKAKCKKASEVVGDPKRQEEIRKHFNLFGWKLDISKERKDERD